MLLPCCPSCGFCLADKEIVINEKINPLIKENIMNMKNNDVNKDKINKILNELNIKNMCCRTNVLTTVDLTELYQ